tara:strand:+ start:625 stop:1113 length:489 start_codon:yes stop_codon:yes gene_type:complete
MASSTLFENNTVKILLNKDTNININIIRIEFSKIINDIEFQQFLHAYAQVINVQEETYSLSIDTSFVEIGRDTINNIKLFCDINKMIVDNGKHKHLLCTGIQILNNNIKIFINSIIQMFYKPYRPLLFYIDNEDIVNFRGECHSKIQNILSSDGNYEVVYCE